MHNAVKTMILGARRGDGEGGPFQRRSYPFGVSLSLFIAFIGGALLINIIMINFPQGALINLSPPSLVSF